MFAAINSFLTRVAGTYLVNKSLRFRSSASAYLTRTFGTPTSGTTWTWSGWVKRGALGSLSEIFTGNSAVNITALEFQSSDTLYFQLGNGTTAYSIGTNAVFRDPAAWYHISVVADTTQASGTITGISTDRIKMYINGVQVTSFIGGSPTPPPQNYVGDWNLNGAAGNIGRWTSGAARYFDGELAEVNFVDGQALAPTAFGAYSTYNQWLPIRYAGTYGTNGFYLPFTNTASTSTLVADSSGNANNWTPNNISLTGGATYDSLTDVPTLTSTTVANYCVINPLSPTLNSGTISNGNLRNVSAFDGSGCIAYGTIGVTSGKFYFEVESVSNGGRGQATLGIYTNNSGLVKYSGDAGDTGYTTYGTYGVAFDVDAGKLWYRNSSGSWVSGDPVAGTSPTSTFTANLITFPYCGTSRTSGFTNSGIGNWNFGQQPFTYTPPTGFLALNTYNL